MIGTCCDGTKRLTAHTSSTFVDDTGIKRHLNIETGIEDRDRGERANLLANVNPTFNWVRLAQRVPVRVALEHIPANGDLVAGRTATVEVLGRKEGSFHLASALESMKELSGSRKTSSP
jgi:multidrug resistance efflux pump